MSSSHHLARSVSTLDKNHLRKYSLMLYRALLKKSVDFHLKNEPSPTRSYRVSYLIPGEEFKNYLTGEIRKQFKQAQRLYREEKKTPEWFEQQLKDGFIYLKGLERAFDEGFNMTHNKRKAIRLSPLLHILKLACGEYGNYHYHQKLKELFLLATLMTYQKVQPKPVASSSTQKASAATTREKRIEKASQ
ncbi:hypothetical protein FDP41_001929 [Naegleria fowleri]|uniref:Uncharacterized protein n=1 Tax=Naegleria fowleri TaxID=5763 RepID=A0A6A5C0Z8_NAEFO|nr:uncharacterized protein FDP41_001929 [Naegleria fowleri]KAF0978859.1 hypothetical protein FDP41_001929 [Naegleria fowleri]CAG4718765.1 unnamed protein product [Naegleria fowleri]